jgi:hypothetical protein
MVNYINMYTRSKKRIKTRMETIVGLYGKGNEIISWHLFCLRSCLVLSDNYCCMAILIKACYTKLYELDRQ